MSSKPKIVVTMSDGSKKEYASVDEWRADARKRTPIQRPGKAAAVKAAKKYVDDLRTGKKTAVNPDSEPHKVSAPETEAETLSRKFKKLKGKKKGGRK